MKTSRSSMRQVAEIARVSPMTVTRVLQGSAPVAEETRQRVMEAVRRVNYIPVRSAWQNRHVRTHILGVVPFHISAVRNRLDSETYEGICAAAREHGYDLLVLLRSESEWMGERQEIRFLDRRSDGFCFISTGEGEWQEVLETLVENEVPTVVCYRRDVPEGVVWVDPDNDAMMHLVVNALVLQGHQRLAYLSAPHSSQILSGHMADRIPSRGNFDGWMRRVAFERTVRDHGCSGVVLENSRDDWSLGADVLEAIRAHKVTGVVCVNDLLALELWQVAASQGWQVPKDLSITGVDDTVAAQLHGLTTVAFGYHRVGSLAVDAWVRHLQGESAASCCRIIPVTLQERGSIAAPASS